MPPGSPNYRSDASHAPRDDIEAEDVPTRISHLFDDVFKVYRLRDAGEQCALIERRYDEVAHFVDELMDVKGYQAIGTAFNSLVHLFEAVELQQKSISLDPDPQTPSHLQNQHNVQQFRARSTQLYHFRRSNFVARLILPQSIELEVDTNLTISQESGRILHHRDVWHNKTFGLPAVLKSGNGVVLNFVFWLAGWQHKTSVSRFKAS